MIEFKVKSASVVISSCFVPNSVMIFVVPTTKSLVMVTLPPIDYQDVIRGVDKVYNNILENNIDFGAHSESGNALIIKNIPLTNINDIQSIVYYNRSGEDRSIGLVLELYNTLNDTDLIYPLASSNVITTYSLRYRFDFPSISSYSGFADENSINEIVIDTIALTETISLSNIEMTGNVSMNNDLSVGNDLTLSGTQINFNSDSFISNTAGSTSGNHLVIFINGTEYKIKLENAS